MRERTKNEVSGTAGDNGTQKWYFVSGGSVKTRRKDLNSPSHSNRSPALPMLCTGHVLTSEETQIYDSSI